MKNYNGEMADDREDVTTRVIRVIAETQKVDPASFHAESTFEDMGVDSLDGINIVFAVEEEFNVTVPDEAMSDLRSVRDVIDGVEKLLAGGELAPPAASPQS